MCDVLPGVPPLSVVLLFFPSCSLFSRVKKGKVQNLKIFQEKKKKPENGKIKKCENQENQGGSSVSFCFYFFFFFFLTDRNNRPRADIGREMHELIRSVYIKRLATDNGARERRAETGRTAYGTSFGPRLNSSHVLSTALSRRGTFWMSYS